MPAKFVQLAGQLPREMLALSHADPHFMHHNVWDNWPSSKLQSLLQVDMAIA
jgi:hypothetical protein